MIFRLKLTNQGDTIVEVLIAIAVLSVVLTATFAIANRNSAVIRQAQEHTVALKIAESQIEQLKTLAETTTSDIFTRPASPGAGFCIINNAGILSTIDDTPDPNCQITDGIPYNISISRVNNSTNKTFTILVHWDSITSTAQDRVSLIYRLDN